MERVRVAVIGSGIIGSLFGELLKELPECDLRAVSDIDATVAGETAARLGVPSYTSTEKLLDSENVDAVVICTPEDTHVAPVIAAAARGKHVFLEKPIASSVDDAVRIGKTCSDAGVKLMVGHCLRFDPRFAAAKRSISAGDIGAVVHIRAWRETSVTNGLLYGRRTTLPLYIGVHDIDIMHWLTGARIVRVFAEGARGRLSDLGVPDSIHAVLRFDNGVVASLCNSWALPRTQEKQRSTILDKGFEVLGTTGMINLEAENIGIRVQTEADIEYPDILYAPYVQGARPGVYRNQLRHFVRSIIDDCAPAVGAAEATEAVRVAVALDRSQREGVPVDVEASGRQ